MIKKYKFPTITSATDGTGSANSPSISGLILGMYVNYSTDSSTDCDVTLYESDPTQTINTLTNTSTDMWTYPYHTIQDASGTTVTFDGTNEIYKAFPVDGQLTVSVTGNTAAATVDVAILYSDD